MFPVILVIIGIFTAILGSLVGIGGGLILVPVFSSILDLTTPEAAGTSLAAVAVFSAVSSFKNRRNHLVETKAAALTAFGSILGAATGVQISVSLPPFYWKILFIIIALFIAWNLLKKNKSNFFLSYHQFLLKISPFTRKHKHEYDAFAMIVTGALVGLIAATLGIGGGFFLTPFFLLGVGLPPKRAVATALLVISITAAVGSFSHFFKGNVNLYIWLFITFGMALGGWIGSNILLRIRDRYIKWMFSAVVLIAIILILMK